MFVGITLTTYAFLEMRAQAAERRSDEESDE
jgi:hypothetical protein